MGKQSFFCYIFAMSTITETELDTDSHNDLQINNLPNRLTMMRIVLIPLVLGMMQISELDWPSLLPYKVDLKWTAGWLCTFVAITDFFDGYIARKKGIVTVFGSFLDPIADKFLVVSTLIMLGSLGRVPVVVVIILVLRELYMTSLRLLATNEGIKVPVNNMGKWKTWIQMTAIPLLIVSEKWWFIDMALWGQIALYISATLSLVSALTYSLNLIKTLKIDRQHKRESRRQAKLEKKMAKENKSQEGTKDDQATNPN
jgi:CDP-diacylglycerol--glycerol-3-phosphate 3-phosphatidyltransferase